MDDIIIIDIKTESRKGRLNMETNPILDSNYHNVKRKTVLLENLKSTDRIIATRLRLTSDVGFPTYDISYLHGTVNGVECTILLPTDHIARKNWKTELINMCKKEGVFIKDIVASHVVSLHV